MVDDLRESGEKGILNKTEVKELFSQIDTLKQAAIDLIADIETLKQEEEPVEPALESTEADPLKEDPKE